MMPASVARWAVRPSPGSRSTTSTCPSALTIRRLPSEATEAPSARPTRSKSSAKASRGRIPKDESRTGPCVTNPERRSTARARASACSRWRVARSPPGPATGRTRTGVPARPPIRNTGGTSTGGASDHDVGAAAAPAARPARPAGRALHAVDVLLQVDHGAALHLPEDLVGRGVVAHEPLELRVELADAGDERDQVGLDLSQAGGDASGLGGRVAGEVVQVGQPVGDRLDDRRLEPGHLAQGIEGMQDAADRCLPLR